ncbi:MAG: hypothetical protein SGILL_004923, partial [Bacillariaceae sp.]
MVASEEGGRSSSQPITSESRFLQETPPPMQQEGMTTITASELCTTYLPVIEEYMATTLDIDESVPVGEIFPFVCSCNLNIVDEIHLRCTSMFLDDEFNAYFWIKEEITLKLDDDAAGDSTFVPTDTVSQAGTDLYEGSQFYSVFQSLGLLVSSNASNSTTTAATTIASCALDERMSGCDDVGKACNCTVCPGGDAVNIASSWFNSTCMETPNPTYTGPGFFGMANDDDPEVARLLLQTKGGSSLPSEEDCVPLEDDDAVTMEDFCSDLSSIEDDFTDRALDFFPFNFTGYDCACGDLVDGNMTVSCNYAIIDSDTRGVETIRFHQEGAYLLPATVARDVIDANGTFTQEFQLAYDRQR